MDVNPYAAPGSHELEDLDPSEDTLILWRALAPLTWCLVLAMVLPTLLYNPGEFRWANQLLPVNILLTIVSLISAWLLATSARGWKVLLTLPIWLFLAALLYLLWASGY
jgi:hypothetical protein